MIVFLSQRVLWTPVLFIGFSLIKSARLLKSLVNNFPDPQFDMNKVSRVREKRLYTYYRKMILLISIERRSFLILISIVLSTKKRKKR